MIKLTFSPRLVKFVLYTSCFSLLHAQLGCNVLSPYAGILLEAYSPLINPGNPWRGSDAPNLLEDPVVKEIATKHNATVGQVGGFGRTCRLSEYWAGS